MNKETLGKEPEETFDGRFDKIYDQAIDNAITTVNNVMRIPHDGGDVFAFYKKVLSELNKLKSNANNGEGTV